jgi:hypothetical protein
LETDIFDLSIRLAKPRTAVASVRQIFEQQFGETFQEDDCWVSVEAKLANASSCFKGDVMFLKAVPGQFEVARVWLHACIRGFQCTLVSKWPVVAMDAVTSTIDATMSDVPSLIETDQLLSSACWSLRRPGVARLIVPFAAKA